MFAQPRPKKPLLPTPLKKRKARHTILEIAFDTEARQDYLTGFHKRKQQRILHAHKIAAERARQERLRFREQIRTDKQLQLEKHIQHTNQLLKEAEAAGHQEDVVLEETPEWDGIQDVANTAADPTFEDQEQEYIDEDRFTTVLIESVSVSRDGLHKQIEAEDTLAPREPSVPGQDVDDEADNKKEIQRKRKKKFRYESKMERDYMAKKQRLKKMRKG